MFGRILFLQGPYQLGFGADLSWFERSELLCSFEMKHLVVPHISMLEEYWHINYPIIGISNPIILSCDIYWHIGNDDLEEYSPTFHKVIQEYWHIILQHLEDFGISCHPVILSRIGLHDDLESWGYRNFPVPQRVAGVMANLQKPWGFFWQNLVFFVV